MSEFSNTLMETTVRFQANALVELFPGQPELDYARSEAEFSDAFGPTARTRIAQERMNARLDRKRRRQQRYQRMVARRALN